ncbi:DUF6782 family putative metallopeptidase [Aliiroseovarius sp. PrR006]|uniref:DUF6782 family putative metallopeptidase n=1 Tax=Aliiroseovarius sp. PrR006 TaxID=2706883 RepID=UPI0013D60568|nr:DUF6782 family putative metallopeptidase [Aliiroseovarius sp. PrR006]NDW54097.1 hypothetical protein [Aliiroseovarius sp. PrR006]
MLRLATFTLACLLGSGIASAGEICISLHHPAPQTDDQQALSELLDNVRPIAEDLPFLQETLQTEGTELCFSDQMNTALGYLDVEQNKIVISEAASQDLKSGILLHELRHLWQFTHAMCPTNSLSMKEYARATFALEADASAVSLLIAWHMKEQGQDAAWTALSNWASHTDIAAAFEETLLSTQDEELAVSYAFYQWYASDARKDRYYIEACSEYLDRQDAEHQIPRYGTLDTEFYESLCRLPDGRRYLCANPLEAKDN